MRRLEFKSHFFLLARYQIRQLSFLSKKTILSLEKLDWIGLDGRGKASDLTKIVSSRDRFVTYSDLIVLLL